MKLILSSILIMLTALPAFAQEVASENLFRESGKIYVVVSVLAIIFLGIFVYLVKLDRKISKLEKEEQ